MTNPPNASDSAEESAATGPIVHCPQEISLTAPESRFRFNPLEKQFVATSGAMERFGIAVIHECLMQLRAKAAAHEGLDFLQTFLIGPEQKQLWFIEDGEAITALLPEDY